MTVLLTHSQVTYAGNGLATAFPTTFSYSDEDDLTVEQRTNDGAWTTKTKGVHYNVSGDGLTEPGGQIDMVVAPPATDDIRITRNTPLTQPTDFGTFTKFTGDTHELSQDHQTRGYQDLQRRIAALEAGETTVTLDPQVVDHALGTMPEPAEDAFPFNVACAGTPIAAFLIGIEESLGVVHAGLGMADITSFAPGQFTVRHIPGLIPGNDYNLKFLVLTA